MKGKIFLLIEVKCELEADSVFYSWIVNWNESIYGPVEFWFLKPFLTVCLKYVDYRASIFPYAHTDSWNTRKSLLWTNSQCQILIKIRFVESVHKTRVAAARQTSVMDHSNTSYVQRPQYKPVSVTSSKYSARTTQPEIDLQNSHFFFSVQNNEIEHWLFVNRMCWQQRHGWKVMLKTLCLFA